jgi:PAS domain S-box-containing protein
MDNGAVRPGSGRPAPLEPEFGGQRLDASLLWMAAIACGFAVVELLMAAFNGGARLAYAGFMTLAFVPCVLIGRALVRRGRVEAAIAVGSMGMMVVCYLIVVALPDLYVVLGVTPLLAVAVALPYTGARFLRRFLAAAWLAGAVLVLLGEGLPHVDEPPDWYLRTLHVLGLAVGVGLLLVLLWQFHRSLSGSLARTREAETRYRTLVDQLPAVTYLDEITGPGPDDTRPIYMSPKAESMFGYPLEEWLTDKDKWTKILHPEDRAWVRGEGLAADLEGRTFSAEYRVIAADGRTLWVREESVRIDDDQGDPRFWQGVIFDVTERKEADEELRRSFELLRRTDTDRRRLLGQLVSAQEEERTRLAGEIHDDPVQKMTAVGLRLQMLRGKLSNPEQVAMLDQLERTVDLAITRLRSLLFELRPPSLDRAGLADALREYIAYADANLPGYRLDNELVTEPSDETRTIAYRIALEALTNVQRHAEAEHVEIVLAEREGGLLMRIRDDGVGMPSEMLSSGRPGHLGLASIRERAEMVGGWSRVDSKGEGTTVEVWLPMDLFSAAVPD